MANGNRDIPVVGGQYTASDNGDGTYNLYDVPIFAELPKGQRRNPSDIDRKWLQAAVDRHAALLGEKYMAPLHVKHHDMGASTERAGFILPKEVRLIQYGGKPVSALFSDLLKIPAAIFKRIQAGELPYRSVEVGDWAKPEIASLALLDDEAPFFKFELLTVGKVIAMPTDVSEATRLANDIAPAMACAGPHFLFRWDTAKLGQMPPREPGEDEEEKDENGQPKPKADPKPQAAGAPAPAQAGAGAPVPPPADGAQPDPAQPKQMEDQPQAGGNQMLALLQQILQAIQGLASQGMAQPPAQPNPGKPAEQPPAPSAHGGAANSRYTEDTVALNADTQKLVEAAAEACAAKSKLLAKEREDARLKLITDAKASLKEYVLAPDTDAELAKLADAGGKDAVDGFVAALKKHLSPVPPQNLNQLAAAKGLVRSDETPADADLKQFADTPERLARARKCKAEYEQLKALGMTSVTLERHLAIQMAHAG